MTAPASLLSERPRLRAEGADEVIDAYLAGIGDTTSGLAAARALADNPVDLAPIRDQVVAFPRAVILAEQPGGGPLLAARWFAPGQPTTVHGHGFAGAALVVEGRSRIERFTLRHPGTVQLESIAQLEAGEVGWWGAPPDDIHRQASVGGGSLELVLIAGVPDPDDASLIEEPAWSSALNDAVLEAFLAGRAAQLAPWYAPDVLGDLNVPQWRFQVRGREALLERLAEEFGNPEWRISHLRLTPTSEGLTVETEQRYTHEGEPRLVREVHLLRCRDDRVVEHTLWCTGPWPAEQIASQWASAPMERW